MMTSTKRFPYCSEEILEIAIKCKHCGEWLDESARPSYSQSYTLSDSTTSVKLALSNKYELPEKIGEGDMAVVYMARQINLDRIVALKVIHRNLVHDKELLDRFHKETRIAVSLNHPNIVTIYDEVNEKGVHFIVMEYLKGIDLQNLIKQKGRLSEKETIRIAISISEALDYAHKKGIIHRYVKNSNIIITHEGRIALTDFGIAQADSGTKSTLIGSVLGNPEYLSPEQSEGKQIDRRRNLFSLGAVLYECLIGSPPFKADKPLTTIYQIINSNLKPVVNFISDVSELLNSCIKKSLSKNPRTRFQTGNEFSSALVNKMFYDISERKSSEQKNFNFSASPAKCTVKITNKDIRYRKTSNKHLSNIISALIFIVLIAILILQGGKEDKSIKNEDWELNNFLVEARNLSINLSSLQAANRLFNISKEIQNILPNNDVSKEYYDQA